jgi:hypothetical protein
MTNSTTIEHSGTPMDQLSVLLSFYIFSCATCTIPFVLVVKHFCTYPKRVVAEPVYVDIEIPCAHNVKQIQATNDDVVDGVIL